MWEHEGKRYAHRTGSDVPGRLPAPSWRARLERFAPPVPKEQLAQYMARFARGRAAHGSAGFRGDGAREISGGAETGGRGGSEERVGGKAEEQCLSGGRGNFGCGQENSQAAFHQGSGQDASATGAGKLVWQRKARVEGSQGQDLDSDWNWNRNWEMGWEEVDDSDADSNFKLKTAKSNSNLKFNSNSNSNAKPSAHLSENPNATSNAAANAAAKAKVGPEIERRTTVDSDRIEGARRVAQFG